MTLKLQALFLKCPRGYYIGLIKKETVIHLGFAVSNIHIFIIMSMLFFGFQSIAKIYNINYGFRTDVNVYHPNKVKVKTWLK